MKDVENMIIVSGGLGLAWMCFYGGRSVVRKSRWITGFGAVFLSLHQVKLLQLIDFYVRY
jgi:hypothetical protein